MDDEIQTIDDPGGTEEMSCSVTERAGENRPGSSCRLRGSATSLAAPSESKTNIASASAPLKQKPCCLCWCCCCSCACSTTPGKSNGETAQTKSTGSTDPFSDDNEPPPSLEEIRSWGNSFDKLMKSPAGRKVFKDFLCCEYSEENILFWTACEELKRETKPEVIAEKIRFIYEEYISILSPKEVSLDSRVREIVNCNMVEPNIHTFDEAQLQIYTLMHRDSYPRFVNSAQYKTLAQLGPDTDGVGGRH